MWTEMLEWRQATPPLTSAADLCSLGVEHHVNRGLPVLTQHS